MCSPFIFGKNNRRNCNHDCSPHFWGFPTKRAMLFLLHCVVNAFDLFVYFFPIQLQFSETSTKSRVCACVCCASTRRTSFFFSLLFIVGDDVLMTGHHPEMDALMAIHWRGRIAVGTCPIAHLSADFESIKSTRKRRYRQMMKCRPGPVCHCSSVEILKRSADRRRPSRWSNQIQRG